VGLGAAVLTAFYMFRLFAMTFLGAPKDEHVYEHAHESPFAMTLPLIVLCALSVAAGWDLVSWHSKLLDPVAAGAAAAGSLHGHEHSELVMALAIGAGLVGLGAGFFVFRALAPARLAALKRPFAGLEAAFAKKFGFDELYREVLLRPAYVLASVLNWADREGVDGAVNGIGRSARRTADASGTVDHVVVDGAVRGTGAAVLAGGGGISRVQSGRIRTYVACGVGAVALVLVLVSWLG
jgi:NADH-quinone oxidoreductase subunit L